MSRNTSSNTSNDIKEKHNKSQPKNIEILQDIHINYQNMSNVADNRNFMSIFNQPTTSINEAIKNVKFEVDEIIQFMLKKVEINEEAIEIKEDALFSLYNTTYEMEKKLNSNDYSNGEKINSINEINNSALQVYNFCQDLTIDLDTSENILNENENLISNNLNEFYASDEEKLTEVEHEIENLQSDIDSNKFHYEQSLSDVIINEKKVETDIMFDSLYTCLNEIKEKVQLQLEVTEKILNRSQEENFNKLDSCSSKLSEIKQQEEFLRKNLQDDNEKYEKEVESGQTILEEINGNIKTESDEIETILREQNYQNNYILNNKTKFRSFEEQRQHLKDECNKNKIEIEELEKKLLKYEDEVEKEIAFNSEEIKRKIELNLFMNNKIISAEGNVKNVKNEIKSLREESVNLKQKFSDIKLSFEESENEVADLEKEQQILTNNINYTKTMLSTILEENEEIENEIQTATSNNENKSCEIRIRTENMESDFRSRIEPLIKINENLKQQRDETEKEKKEIAESKLLLQTLENKISALTNIIVNKESEIKKLDEENNYCTWKIKNAEQFIASCSRLQKKKTIPLLPTGVRSTRNTVQKTNDFSDSSTDGMGFTIEELKRIREDNERKRKARELRRKSTQK